MSGPTDGEAGADGGDRLNPQEEKGQKEGGWIENRPSDPIILWLDPKTSIALLSPPSLPLSFSASRSVRLIAYAPRGEISFVRRQ